MEERSLFVLDVITAGTVTHGVVVAGRGGGGYTGRRGCDVGATP